MYTKVGSGKETLNVVPTSIHRIAGRKLDLTAVFPEFFLQYLNFRNVSKSEGLFSEV